MISFTVDISSYQKNMRANVTMDAGQRTNDPDRCLMMPMFSVLGKTIIYPFTNDHHPQIDGGFISHGIPQFSSIFVWDFP
jgi:hypothetical protein